MTPEKPQNPEWDDLIEGVNAAASGAKESMGTDTAVLEKTQSSTRDQIEETLERDLVSELDQEISKALSTEEGEYSFESKSLNTLLDAGELHEVSQTILSRLKKFESVNLSNATINAKDLQILVDLKKVPFVFTKFQFENVAENDKEAVAAIFHNPKYLNLALKDESSEELPKMFAYLKSEEN